MMTMSDEELLEGGMKVMLVPVGNWPGPEITDKVTGTLLLMGVPPELSIVTINWASCVPSTAGEIGRSVVSCMRGRRAVARRAGGGTAGVLIAIPIPHALGNRK